MTTPADAWPLGPDGQPVDESACPVCGNDSCTNPEHLPPEHDAPSSGNGKAQPDPRVKCSHVLDPRAVCSLCGLAFGLDVEGLDDAVKVAAEGRAIAEAGIPFVLDGIIPDFGMLGFLVAYAKVGKTSFGQAMGAAISSGAHFLERKTKRVRVLYAAPEDPREYTAYLARHLAPEPERMTFYRRPLLLNDDGVARLMATAKAGGYGLVLIASWQAVVRGLIKDENDNAGAVSVVERVKLATRELRIPWLIDAHSGRGEDQSDDADPVKALRGASAAAGAADYLLSLRTSNGAFGTQRRLSGRGRFVNVAPLTLDYHIEDGTYDLIGATKDAGRETTWRLLLETGAITATPQSVDVIARAGGWPMPRSAGASASGYGRLSGIARA